MSISVVIPTFNRGDILEKVWPSYQQHGVAEIIIIDDGSTDDSLQRIQKLHESTKIPVKIVRHERRCGQQVSRLSGVAESSSDWILFGEDDVWLGSQYAETLRREAFTYGAAVIAGSLVNVAVREPFSTDVFKDTRTQTLLASEVPRVDLLRLEAASLCAVPVETFLLHSIALVRKDLVTSIGFDSAYGGTAAREETDFYLTAMERGHKILYTSSCVCFHLRGALVLKGGHREGGMCWSRIEYWRALNTLRLMTKHWEFLQRRFGVSGTPLLWTISYMAKEKWAQLRRIIRRKGRLSVWSE